MSGKLFRQYIYCGILILFFLWLKSPAAFAQTVGRCANFTVSLSGGGSASQSDQFNTASSFPATNIIPRVPAPGETITFSSSGTGYFNINWIRPLGSPDTGCNFYIFTGNTGVMPNWKTGTLIRNDSYGTTNCQGKPLNFDNGVVYGNNWLGTATFTATTPWCRNIDQNSAQGYLYSGTTASTNRCANACIIQSLPNFSRSYTINGIPQCPAGKLPSTDLHLFYSVWPGANGQQLNWQYTPKNRSTMSFSSSSTYAGSSYYVGMEPVAGGAAFQPVGTKPHPLMNYQTNWVPSTWNAMWSIGLVPSGTYNITYQVPDNLCVAPTAPVFTQATCNAAGVMTLNWNPVAGVSSYALSAQNTSVAWDNCANTNGNYCSETVPSSSTTYSFQASPGKSYSVWMHGKYGDTYGPAGSDTVACNIPPPTGFSGVCSGKSATFTWTPAPGINTYYWRLRDLTTNTDVYNETLGLPNVTGSSFTYNAMTPGHNYRAWIHSQLPNVITPNWSAAVFSEFACPLPSPTPLPSATPTPTPTYTPTPSPLPSGYCTTSANCTGGQVCANNGCLVPSPTPSATATPTPTTAPTSTPVLSPTPNCSLRNHGDANCDCVVDAADYTIWRNEFLNLVPQERADFSSKAECKDTAGKPNFVCTFDLDIWRDGMTRGLTCDNTQPTGGPTATPIPASTIIPTAVPTGVTPSPTPLPSLTPTTAVPTTTPPVLPPLVDSNYLGVKTKFIADESINLSSTSISSVNVVFARQVTWRDGCMGCGGTVCTQALTSGYRVVVSGPSNTQTGKCVYRAYHFKTNATTMCNESPNARIVTDCGADPIPAPADGVAQ